VQNFVASNSLRVGAVLVAIIASGIVTVAISCRREGRAAVGVDVHD